MKSQFQRCALLEDPDALVEHSLQLTWRRVPCSPQQWLVRFSSADSAAPRDIHLVCPRPLQSELHA